MNNPEWEPLEQQQLSTNRIAPVYPLTANITQRWLRRLMGQVVPYWAQRVSDPLPEQIRRSAGLMDLSSALTQAHFPDSMERLKAARHRLAFDEIFLLQLGVLRQKYAWQERTAQVFDTPGDWLEDQIARLPFALTAQRRVCRT
jgi:ATP-dependent DNA helicase RecG